MAIQKRFIHFKKFSDFNSKKLSANEANTQYTVGVSGAIQNGDPDILYQSYVWIKDTQQQWTHGQLYNGIDSPIVKGDAENSAVLKGEYKGYSNKTISQVSVAVGAATTAGLKGWYYSAIDFTNNIITLSDKQPYALLDNLVGGAWSSGTPNISEGDKVSIVNNAKYDYCGEVKSISGNKVTLKSALPFNTLDIGTITVNNPDDWSIYLPEKESAGIIDFGGGALAEGVYTKATNIGSHAEGIQTHAYGQYSHTEGKETEAAYAAHAEGVKTKATGNDAHAEGHITTAKGDHSHAEGRETTAIGYASHAEGLYSIAGIGNRPAASTVNDPGRYSHAEGNGTQASGNSSHSEGKHTLASGNFSHAEGFNSEATEQCAHAEGSETHATKLGAHAEGARTEASGVSSHAEGIDSIANGRASHAEGLQTRASNEAEHACGMYNKSTKSSDKAQATQFSIGIGTFSVQKNAFEVKQNGDVYIEGIGGYEGNNSDEAEDVATLMSTPITDAELDELFND